MKKLKTVIRYECVTSLKYIWIYYLALAVVFSIVFTVIYLLTHETNGVNCLEMNSMILVGIAGILQMQEDFRMLLQNGFTRTCIFLATIAQFAFIAGTLSLVDTMVGILLRRFLPDSYDTLFGSLYGYHHLAVSGWFWLFLLYLLISSLGFFFALALGRMTKKLSIFAGTVLGAVLLLGIPLLFTAGSLENQGQAILTFASRSFGFMADGTVRLANPVFLLSICIGILSAGSYLIIRHTELKTVH